MEILKIVLFTLMGISICSLCVGLGYKLRGCFVEDELRRDRAARRRAEQAAEDAARAMARACAEAGNARLEAASAARLSSDTVAQMARRNMDEAPAVRCQPQLPDGVRAADARDAALRAGTDAQREAALPTETEREALRRAREEQEAFRLLRSYNVETAYGMDTPLERLARLTGPGAARETVQSDGRSPDLQGNAMTWAPEAETEAGHGG